MVLYYIFEYNIIIDRLVIYKVVVNSETCIINSDGGGGEARRSHKITLSFITTGFPLRNRFLANLTYTLTLITPQMKSSYSFTSSICPV